MGWGNRQRSNSCTGTWFRIFLSGLKKINTPEEQREQDAGVTRLVINFEGLLDLIKKHPGELQELAWSMCFSAIPEGIAWEKMSHSKCGEHPIICNLNQENGVGEELVS